MTIVQVKKKSVLRKGGNVILPKKGDGKTSVNSSRFGQVLILKKRQSCSLGGCRGERMDIVVGLRLVCQLADLEKASAEFSFPGCSGKYIAYSLLCQPSGCNPVIIAFGFCLKFRDRIWSSPLSSTVSASPKSIALSARPPFFSMAFFSLVLVFSQAVSCILFQCSAKHAAIRLVSIRMVFNQQCADIIKKSYASTHQ